jgi:lysozyme
VGHLITDHDRMIWQDRRLKGGHYIISESEMLTLLRSDVARVEGAIESRKGEYWHNRNMLDSIASFCFNVGTGVLKRDWMQELIETESIALMEDHWPKWNKAGGKVIRGLTVRRAAEVVWAKKGMVAKGGRESG